MADYEATRQRHIEHLLPQIGEHFERVGWSAERLRAERTAQLRELVGWRWSGRPGIAIGSGTWT